MKLIHTLKQETLSLSFEVFPPKQDAAFDSVKKATEEIAKLHPAFVSVTYGAGGGTSKYTLDIAKNIKNQYNVQTLAPSDLCFIDKGDRASADRRDQSGRHRKHHGAAR